jgi:signal transduction histidine kinase
MRGGKIINRLRRSLRGSILTAFSVLLLVSFLLVGGIFNISVRWYIRNEALGMLDERKQYFYVSQYFEVASGAGNFGPPGAVATAYGEEIAAVLRSGGWRPAPASPSAVRNRRVRTDNGVFFVVAEPSVTQNDEHEGQRTWYRMYYTNITDFSRFSARVNVILFLLVGAVWAAAMVIATFLAGSLAYPLQALSVFARQIGRGDFTPNAEIFANEEFETLNQNLNYAARQLSRYDNEQKTFFQNVSHELRTPLMSIKSYAEGIKYGIMDAREASVTILNATDRLTGMVDDILYVSRIDNITLPNPDKVDVCEVIAERVRLHETPAYKGIISFAPPQPVVIMCIKAYIERAFDNLISNALRYTENQIHITCCAQGPWAVVCITDDGPGFEPASLPHVFERFYRGKNGLSGIGLAIVKSIVDQHGGTATAENTEKGAKLTIRLPRLYKNL